MDLQRLASTLSCRWLGKCLKAEVGLTVLTFVMIAAFHRAAVEDRLLLNLYYIGIVGAAYSLVKRRAFALAVLIVFVASGTTLGHVYFASRPGSDPLLGPVGDLLSLSILLFLVWLLGAEAYRLQTEEHRLELRRRIDERAMATRAAALTSTSHEVRQPLSAILSITEMLTDDSAGPMNDVQREFIESIDDCAKHLMALVNDILDYAKAEAGMIELSHEAVALPDLVDQCVAMVESKAAEGRVTITAHVEPDVTEIVADPLRLRQILLNLLSNAVKYNEEGGFVKMQVRGSQGQVLISVRDTGRGVSEEQIEHLFDPYYQAARGDQGIGTGLGLSIIKHLVELHGGSVCVESVVGSGSVFTVQLPRDGNLGAEIGGSSMQELIRQDMVTLPDMRGERQEEVAVGCGN